MDDAHRVLGRLTPRIIRGRRRIDHVLADMILDHLGDEAVHGSPA